jgi:hypothetical protein
MIAMDLLLSLWVLPLLYHSAREATRAKDFANERRDD